MVDGYFGSDPEASPVRRGNFMARMRMAVLYDRSVTWRGLVVGTGNKTESLIGYTTLFGDSACAFNPIGDLYKSQIRQMAEALGVPEAIIRKAPLAAFSRYSRARSGWPASSAASTRAPPPLDSAAGSR